MHYRTQRVADTMTQFSDARLLGAALLGKISQPGFLSINGNGFLLSKGLVFQFIFNWSGNNSKEIQIFFWRAMLLAKDSPKA